MTSPETTTPSDRRWWTLGAVCVATFMLLLDITIVNVALPDIAKDLGSSFSDLQWVVDAYALSLAALLLTAGSLADLLGRRRVFVLGLAIFTAASLLCALATSPFFLDIARGLQGVGAAAMFATSLALLAASFSGRERGTAFGAWGATTGAAVAVGPLVGGVFTESFGWESIFLLNVPIGIAAIAATLWRVEESSDPGRRRRRLGRPGDVLGRPLPARLRARARQPRGLGQPAHRRGSWSARSCSWSPSSSSSAVSRARCSTSRCCASRRSPERRSPRSPCRRRSSRCSST